MKDYPNLNDTYMTTKLREQLAEIKNYPMTLIVAPAGYGKSTAVRWWDDYRKHYIHKSLSYCLNILSDDLDVAWEELCFLIGKDYPLLSEKMVKIGFPKNEHMLQLLAQLWKNEEEMKKEIFIIVDDIHLLPYSSISPVLLFLAERMPSNLHILLVSRNIVFSQSQRLKLGRRIFQISVDYFRMNKEEIGDYANYCGLPLSKTDTEKLAEFSGGWISLIYLAFCNFAQAGNWEFSTADIDSLITEVMLDPLPQKMREFLTVCSVSAEFTEEMAEYLWNNPEAKTFLEKLLHENAFIVRNKEGVYHCHNLLLKNTMKEFLKFSIKRQQDIWERLGDWYFKKDEFLQAAISYRKAGDWDKLLHTVAVDRNSSLGGSHVLRGHEWYENCPKEILRRHPAAILIFALQFFIDGDIPSMLEINKFLMEVVSEDSTLSEQEKANYAGESQILLGFLEFNNISGMSRYHRSACELMDRESYLVNHRSPWTFGSPSILALYHRKSGEMDKENATMQECMPYYYELTDHHGNGSEISMQAEIELMRGHFQEAEIHYYHAARAARRKNQCSIMITAEFIAMRLALFKGKFKEVEKQLSDIRKQFLEISEYVLLPSVDLCEAWLFSMLGQQERIPELIWSEDLVKTIMSVSAPVVQTIRNEALLASGKYTQLVSFYEETRKMCEESNMLLCGIYSRIQMSVALFELGQKKEARSILIEALEYAEADDLILPFAEHGERLRSLLKELDEQNKYKDMLKKIFALTENFEKARQKISKDYFGQVMDYGLSSRELEIAQLAARRKTTKEISAELCLSENTVRNHLGHIFEKMGIDGSARNKREKLEKIFPQLL